MLFAFIGSITWAIPLIKHNKAPPDTASVMKVLTKIKDNRTTKRNGDNTCW